jgi:hypothetical protein
MRIARENVLVQRCDGNLLRGKECLLCEYAVPYRAVIAVASENGAAGFELPIRKCRETRAKPRIDSRNS